MFRVDRQYSAFPSYLLQRPGRLYERNRRVDMSIRCVSANLQLCRQHLGSALGDFLQTKTNDAQAIALPPPPSLKGEESANVRELAEAS